MNRAALLPGQQCVAAYAADGVLGMVRGDEAVSRTRGYSTSVRHRREASSTANATQPPSDTTQGRTFSRLALAKAASRNAMRRA